METDTAIAEGYDPNGSYVGITALQIAVETPNEDIFLLLLKFGADPEKHTASRARGMHGTHVITLTQSILLDARFMAHVQICTAAAN